MSPSSLGKHLGQADANTRGLGGHLPEQKAADLVLRNASRAYAWSWELFGFTRELKWQITNLKGFDAPAAADGELLPLTDGCIAQARASRGTNQLLFVLEELAGKWGGKKSS